MSQLLNSLNFLVVSHTCKSCACPCAWALPKHLCLYLLLKLTHLLAKVFGTFWCCFSFEFSDVEQPSFRAFAKLSIYSHFKPSPCSSSIVFHHGVANLLSSLFTVPQPNLPKQYITTCCRQNPSSVAPKKIWLWEKPHTKPYLCIKIKQIIPHIVIFFLSIPIFIQTGGICPLLWKRKVHEGMKEMHWTNLISWFRPEKCCRVQWSCF